MKLSDIEALNEVYSNIKNGDPIDEDLFCKFEAAIKNTNEALAKQKQRYSENADMYRQRSKQWREDNHERKADYQREYTKRDYVKKKAAEKKKKKRGEAER